MRRDAFHALADPTRRDIIRLVGNRSMSQHAIADHFETSRQAISKHIKLLAECGLMVITQKGEKGTVSCNRIK